ncbi:MAG TPA: shikimate kinase [Gemmatimonadaceae bacterium]|nr:shikimate kinase [Gemmatimonadaceae bacterium]
MTGGSATDKSSHIILVGLPGAGKTSVGRALARALGRAFLDFDEEIERREQRSIARIFRESGEAHFRALETSLTRELVGQHGMILSPGGGWATDPSRVALLRPPARMIYLRVSPVTAVARLMGAGGLASRPLLVGHEGVSANQTRVLAALEQLGAEREPQYATADAVIDTEGIDIQRVTDRVARLVAP